MTSDCTAVSCCLENIDTVHILQCLYYQEANLIIINAFIGVCFQKDIKERNLEWKWPEYFTPSILALIDFLFINHHHTLIAYQLVSLTTFQKQSMEAIQSNFFCLIILIYKDGVNNLNIPVRFTSTSSASSYSLHVHHEGNEIMVYPPYVVHYILKLWGICDSGKCW